MSHLEAMFPFFVVVFPCVWDGEGRRGMVWECLNREPGVVGGGARAARAAGAGFSRDQAAAGSGAEVDVVDIPGVVSPR